MVLNMKKKILIVTTVPVTLYSILGGQPKYLNKFFTVELASSPGNLLKEVSNRENVITHDLVMERKISLWKDVVSLISMIRLILAVKPDIVHSYTPKAGLITILASFICRVPVRVHTFTGLIFPTSQGMKKRILIWTDRLICACATVIVPEGQGVKQDLLSYRITNKPLDVIGSGNIAGVDTKQFNREMVINNGSDLPLIKELDLPVDAFTFCFVGRFTQDKGFTELLEAFDKLADYAHLLVVGEMDERLPLSDDITQRLNNHSRIHNIGWQNDIRPALTISNVLVLPSYREGFPNAPLQAGAMSLPSIVTDINGCNEIIKPGFNGWLVPVKDSHALYEAMLSAMNRNDLLQFGENARVNIEVNFEQSNHWENMLSFYQDKISQNTIK